MGFKIKCLLIATLGCLSVLGLALPNAYSKTTKDRPNIILIMADDMGFSDLGCTGSEIETPFLDQLASDGLLFDHCYNTSRCCPTRAALLTGQFQWDAGIGHMISTRSNLPEYQQALNPKCPTLAERLQANGYQTFMAGKWHLGNAREAWPDKRGFDQFYGTPTGGGLYFYPSKHYDRPVYHNGKQIQPNADWYSTDGFTDYTIDYLKNQREKDRPFFIYLAYIAPHYPLQAKQSDIDKYRTHYLKGYEAIRNARFEKQKRLGLVSNKVPMSKPTHPKWELVKDKKQEALKMAVYAAQIDCLDHNIGRLMEILKEENLMENTLLMFLSDNGGCSANFNKTKEEPIGSRFSNAAYGHWHNISNTPYRMAKSQEHEGGIITPLIVHWPQGISKPQRIIKQPMHVMDIMPACLELAGVDYLDNTPSDLVSELDGESFLPLIEGKPTSSDRVFFWEHEGNQAVRKGDWKLVSLRNKHWQLHNLANDPYEEQDLSDKHSEIVKELQSLYKQWSQQHGVQPWPLKRK